MTGGAVRGSSFCKKKKPAENQQVSHILGGERGIRTPGTSRYGSFQDYCNRPLYHLSSVLRPKGLSVALQSKNLESGCKGSKNK